MKDLKAPVFATLGCRLNAYETEAMREMAEAAGLQGAVIVNTCAVTAEAVRKARQEIRRLSRENPGAPVIVTGCAAQTEPETFAAMPEVARVVGNHEKMQPATWASLAAPDFGTERVMVDDIMSVRETAGHLIDGFGRHRAYVQVQNGCDHRCTFCIIPFGRGNSRSLSPDEAVAQARRLVEGGAREVVLTGVDITSYAPGLGLLVRQILREVLLLNSCGISWAKMASSIVVISNTCSKCCCITSATASARLALIKSSFTYCCQVSASLLASLVGADFLFDLLVEEDRFFFPCRF